VQVPALGPEVWHTPACLQAAGAAQTTGFAPTQTPPWQDDVVVHGLPSSQVVPFGWLAQGPVPVAALKL
jgi:hypothetical protein